MRDDDNHARRFMPVFRRIIILVAVVTAVPVVMWTTTAFVRTYLGPPKGPTAQDAAPLNNGAPDDAAAAAPTNNPTAAPPADTKTAQLPPVPPNPAANPLSGTPNGGGPTITITSSVTPAAKTPVTPAPVAVAPPPPKVAMSNPTQSDPAPSQPAPGGAPLAPDRAQNDIWPTPPATPAAATADLTAPTADATPQSEPLAGPVPLPRKRPSYFVMAEAGVPLPRPRPTATAPSVTDAPASPFDWLHNLFHPASSTAPTSAQQEFTGEH